MPRVPYHAPFDTIDVALVADVEALRPTMLRMAHARGFSTAEADDLVTNAILRFYATKTPYEPGSTLLTKLRRALEHRMGHAALAKRKHVRLDDLPPSLLAYSDDPTMTIAVREALLTLPPAIRDAVIKHVIEGHTLQALGDAAGIAGKNMWRRVQKGLAQLRQILTSEASTTRTAGDGAASRSTGQAAR